MYGVSRFELSRWGIREWAMTALALVVVLAVLLLGGRGLAAGALGEVLGVRFGGDAERTRIVVDLDRSARGQVIETGADGKVVLTLTGVAPGRGLDGNGSGLVRGYRVVPVGTASRVQFDLARNADIERRFLLPPGDGVAHYRYVVDLKATGTSPVAARPIAPRAETRRAEKPLIVIDAGHGGRDPGARGAQHNESSITLAAALQLKRELERTNRYRVRLTRDSDVHVDLNRRVRIAREAEADLFISLHADAGADPATRGASVYTLSEQGANRAVREVTRLRCAIECVAPGSLPNDGRVIEDARRYE